MVVFNYLVPALTLTATVQTIISLGNGPISTGGQLVVGHLLDGTLTSDPAFETQIQGNLTYANDFPVVDPNDLHSRPNLRGVIVTDDKEYLQFLFQGIQSITTPDLGAGTTGTGSASLPFGAFQSVFVVSFRTGAKKYKNLEDSVFVASETVKSIDSKSFRAGLKISKIYSTKTNVTLD